MDLQEGDKLAESVAVAPRVTLADIEANIVAEYIFTGRDLQKIGGPASVSIELLTICIIVLRNGYTLVGESACADERNFDAEVGRRFAREAAIRKAWPLMGYALRERLHEQAHR